MIKKVMAAAAVAASVVGASAAVAAPAMAIGNDNGVTTTNGNGAEQVYGNQATYGNMSPQMALIQGSLNKPCIGLPAKANLASLVGLVPVTVAQDVPILSAPQNQQCTENSTQAKGDEPLSHILDNIPVLSGNGAAGS
ncbi:MULTISPECIES: rodlin [unclassified Streptomyces]|uniref:rodlin n=1 Tax=unclassified Streptomyces TaxID=2593676 RepID=UPI00190B9108|nr:rodlin [Streptomyces sp. MBT65]MBK3579677.1 RdlA protein [Streptomyces sp. MBT65]